MENSHSGRFVQVGDFRVAYREQGQGEPLVLLHGWPTYSYLWRHQLLALAERFHVIAPDLPGFGDSSKPADVHYSVDFYAGILDSFLNGLGIDPVGIVSHDLGGPIALLWAVRQPERVTRLVITDTMPYPDLPLMVRSMLWFARLPGLGKALVSRRGLRLALQIGTANRGVVTPELVEAYDRPFSQDPAARKTLLRILVELEPAEMVEIADGLPRIAAPTLILWAEKDPSAPLGIARRLQADIDGAQLRIIPNCGHFLTEDRPQEVNRFMLEFLSQT